MDDKWKITDQWEWNNPTKITLLGVIVGIFIGTVLTLLMKFLKGTI
tara:strand:- start:178 stop:315 length:138 start_codon:yes stop_codon:yes gene_type:complete